MERVSRPRAHPLAVTYWHVVFAIAVGLLVAMSGFATGVVVERDQSQRGRSAESRVLPEGEGDFPQLDEIANLLEVEFYGRPANLDHIAAFRQRLQTDAILGMTRGLDDPYTMFLPPLEAAPLADQLAGEYEGIGVWVESPDGRLTVVAPMPGSPAERAGLLPGDVLLAADGVSLEGLGEVRALALVRGPSGSFVEITLLRPGGDASISVNIERSKILTPVVEYTLLPGGFAQIRIVIFGEQTPAELDRAMARAADDGASGIVLDLRNNGGGWVTGAQETIGRFVDVESGPALYEVHGSAVEEAVPLPILTGDNELGELPVVVLINEGTASAAEIVAGALQYYDRATLVGRRTFGKGSVQRVHDFEDGSSARITFAHWLTPGQDPIEGIGIRPDIVVVSESAPGSEEDKILVRGLEELSRNPSRPVPAEG